MADSATPPQPGALADAGADTNRAPGTLSGRRRALIWPLIVLASLIGLGSILTSSSRWS
jgi:hypothetical protein